MKKLLSIFALMLVVITANAQTTLEGDMNHDGRLTITDVVKLVDIILKGTPLSYLSCPDDHHPHLIDLGLPSGTKWACCNVGATTPDAYGGYFAWGETEEKDYYYYDTYIHCDGSYGTCHDLGSDIAGTQYDVAQVKWGGSWVMPSLDQIEELLENCTSTWKAQNGVNGRVFTGSNGGSIFLPASGNRWKDGLYEAGSVGDYWSSTPYPGQGGVGGVYDLYFFPGNAYWQYNSNINGLPVRPVFK